MIKTRIKVASSKTRPKEFGLRSIPCQKITQYVWSEKCQYMNMSVQRVKLFMKYSSGWLMILCRTVPIVVDR